MGKTRCLWLLSLSFALNVGNCLNTKENFKACTTCDCRFSKQEVIVICQGKNLSEIPSEFPSNITILDLSDNVLSTVPVASFKNLSYLRSLDLSKNQLTSVPTKALSNLGKLQRLNLDENTIRHIPNKAFEGLKSLSDLSLVNVTLKRFPNLTGTNSLQVLALDRNKITTFPPDFCKRFPKLYKLSAQMNNIKNLPDMSDCLSLESINLDHNNITSIHLQGMSNLKKISLKDNQITYISKNAFKAGKNSLIYLNLRRNYLTAVPTAALKHLEKLQNLDLGANPIKVIKDDAFVGLNLLSELTLRRTNLTAVPTKAFKNVEKLQKLDLSANPIKEVHKDVFEGLVSLQEFSISWEKVEKVDHEAFRKLPSLRKLSLVNVNLKEFPDLTETDALQDLILESNFISSLPKNFCQRFPRLYNFNANMNRIISLPNMSRCTSMVLLHLVFNRITSIGSSLGGMSRLKDITLKQNAITEIPNGAFTGNVRLENLNLAHNKINHIAEDAFVSLESLIALDLSYNEFLKLPSKGMQRVRELKLRGNKRLTEISAESLPNVRWIEASYPYHCCQFRQKINEISLPPVDKKTSITNKGWTWDNFEGMDFLNDGSGNETVVLDGDDELSGFGSAPMDSAIIQDGAEPETEIPSRSYINSSIVSQAETLSKPWDSPPLDVNCTPLPDPFFPCEDLMGSWWLRVGVWCVFMLALLGNAVVVIVIVLSKTKIDVSKFLIINLAVADLCMGVYLGCLAIVDASTIGNFMHHGVDWQQSSGCKTAGYLAVLSSEASVFTLAVITIERYIAIRHALHVERKMSLRKTAIVMTCGWILAFIIATLPLVKISDYSKFSICLPFETGDEQSLAFVTLLLTLNLVAFVVIFGCYVRIYFEIRGSNAWNTSDTQVALRMALLVVTDFACWAPIVIIALPAAFGSTFVSLEQAKFFTVFIFPLNSCANPFLYAIFTYQFKKDCLNICRRVQNSPVPPAIQISLTKKRLSMSGIPVELRPGSRASNVYMPETQSDGKMTLKIPSLKLNRRYSLPAAFKLAAGSRQVSGKSSGAEYSDNENSRCSNENCTEQTSLQIAQDKTRQTNAKNEHACCNNNRRADESSEENTTKQKQLTVEKPLIDRRTAV